nr:MAG TPA: hypothetical protein [Caudoviricetes sp.]
MDEVGKHGNILPSITILYVESLTMSTQLSLKKGYFT